MQRNRLFVLEAVVKLFTLKHLRNREFCRQLDPIRGLHLFEPLVVEADFGGARRQDLVHLLHVGLGVFHQLFGAELWSRGRATGRVTNHTREVADQENDRVSEILKMFQLAHQHGMTEVKVGRSGIESGLDAQRLARCK